ncbi:MAG: response regulator [Planctomycetota bacterium]|jgi:DNA-binding NtrC family response regulator
MATRHILVVDDDVSILRVLEAALARPEWRIDTARNLMVAEQMVMDKRYDLVLCDIFLPDNRRLELVDTVKAIDLDYRVILMSGYLGTGEEDMESDQAFTRNTLLMEAESKGVWATLEKPFDLQKLISTVEEALG